MALIVATGFFVAGEFGIVAVERSTVERRAQEGDRRAQRILKSLRNLSFELSGAQLGITVTSLLLGFIAEPVIAELLQPWMTGVGFLSETTAIALSVALAFIVTTMAHMVFGELVPKNLAIARPYRTAIWFGVPMQTVNRALRPLILFLNNSADWTVRKLGIEPRAELAGVRSIEELELMIRSSGEEGHLDDDEMALLTRAIIFTEKIAAEAMVPRVKVVALGRDRTITDLRVMSSETGHSRFPVYGTDLDDTVGTVHVKDTVGVPAGQRSTRLVEEITQPALLVPETSRLEYVLTQMQLHGRGMAVVIDEYGGTAGIVTIEDVLEEFFGDIEDEYDPATSVTEDEADGGDVLSGLLDRHEVEERIGFEWPDGPYDTLGGFLVATAGQFPEVGQRIAVDGFVFEILEMDGQRVATVGVTRPGEDSAVS